MSLLPGGGGGGGGAYVRDKITLVRLCGKNAGGWGWGGGGVYLQDTTVL